MKHEFDNRANNPSPNHIFSEIDDTLFSTANDAMLVVNGAGEFIEVNTVGCELTGYGRTALLTLSLPDLFFAVTDGERPLSFSDLSPAKNGQCDCVLRDRDGRSFSVDIKTHSLADNRTLLIVHPTARHPAPASEYTFLRNVLNTIPDAVWLKDPDGVYLTANPMFERFIGLKEADLLGKTDYDLFEPELAEFFRRHDRNAVLAGKPTINEEWVTMAVGDHRVLLETVKTPLYDEAGQLLGVLGVARDITEREQAEVAIKKLAKFPDENPHPIMRVTQDGAVLYGNQASARLLKKWGCTVGQPLPNVWRQHIQGTLVSGVSREKEIAVDGRVFSLSIVPLVEYGYVNIYGYDITERRRVEQAIYLMSEAQQQIAHLDSLLGVYQLVGEKVQELLGDAFTASSMFDEKIQAMRIAGLYGFGSRYENLVRRFNIDPSRMTYSLADMTAEELRMFRSGQLEKFEGGLYALLTRKVPRQICEAAEKRLKIASIYTMGFVWNGIHYGGLTILAKKDIAPYKEMIETIMNQAAIAINRLKSEEALRESEEKLRLFIEHAPASLAMFDREMRYLAVSHRWLADYNLGNQEVIGRSHYDVFPEIPERWKAVHRRGLAGEVIQADEDEFLRADGTIQWERWEVRPWYTADGAIGGIVIFTEDITERKQARKALQESQDILTTAESVAKIGSWKWDLNTQKVTWSKEMFHLFGIDAENFDDDVNKVIKNRVHPDDIEAVNQSNLSVLEHSNPLPLEYRIILPDGTERLVWAEGRLIYDQLGNPTALVGYVQDITERKQAEQAIRESEERYHNTLENMLEGCQIIGFDWRYLYLNASAARHGRCPQEELLGRTMMEAYPGIENTDMFAVLRRCMAERTPYRLENKFQYGDGSFAWFDLSIQPVPEGLFILSIDITERKQAETALQEMAENMAEAQRMTHYGSWEVRLTPELEFIDPQIWSDECYRIFGVEPGSIQITKDYFYAHVHSEDREAAQQALWRAIHDGTEAVYEYRLFRPDGSIRNIHDRIKVVLDEQSGRPVKVVGIVQDITESKQAEATIDQLHRRMEMILNSAGEGIYGTDVNGRITFVNPAMAQMTGWELNELLGQDAHAVFHHTRADDTPYPADECTIRLAMQDGRSYHTDDDMYWHKEGTPLPVEYTSTPIRQNGQIIGTVMVVKDITERKRVEVEQARLEEQLRQAQKMESIGRLAGGVAHDFNNQLTIIQLYSDLMRAGMAKGDPLLPKLEQIHQATEHAAGLTRQLLAFSRKQVLQPVILDLNDLVTNLQKMLDRLIGEDITLSTVLEPGLWPIKADPGQIEQVIMNLVVNARDAMPTGGTLTIETGSLIIDEQFTNTHLDAPLGPCVMLAVTDTGHGMDRAIQNQIFEPFFTTKEAGKGTGLGLATVHGIVKQSGGAIYVYSEPGQGATFKVYLPASESATSPLVDSLSAKMVQRGHETVLLVEDEQALRDLVQITLQEMGYTVLEAGNGREAIELAERHPAQIDLLLTDVIMPQMSGGELAQILIAQRSEMKVLFVSGYMDDDVVRHGLLTAEVDFLSKPFTRSMLASKVRDVLDRA